MPSPPVQYIVPVLAGGGTRLPAHVGVLTALRDMNYGYKHIVGVSGGSVVAALAAFGKTPEHMRDLFRDVDFSQFRGYSLINLLFRGGLSNGKRFEHWLTKEIDGATFKDRFGAVRVNPAAQLERDFRGLASRTLSQLSQRFEG